MLVVRSVNVANNYDKIDPGTVRFDHQLASFVPNQNYQQQQFTLDERQNMQSDQNTNEVHEASHVFKQSLY